MKPIGNIKYIRNLFYFALSDMAIGSGSLSKRLASAYTNYLYKIEWHRDIELVPIRAKEDFEILGKLVMKNVQLSRSEIETKFMLQGLSKNQISRFVNDQYVISKLHWKIAKKMAGKIQQVHFLLSLEIEK